MHSLLASQSAAVAHSTHSPNVGWQIGVAAEAATQSRLFSQGVPAAGGPPELPPVRGPASRSPAPRPPRPAAGEPRPASPASAAVRPASGAGAAFASSPQPTAIQALSAPASATAQPKPRMAPTL